MKIHELEVGALYRATNGKTVKVLEVTPRITKYNEKQNRKERKVTSVCVSNPARPKTVGEQSVHSLDTFLVWAYEKVS